MASGSITIPGGSPRQSATISGYSSPRGNEVRVPGAESVGGVPIQRDPGVQATPDAFGAGVGAAVADVGQQLGRLATTLQDRRQKPLDGAYTERHGLEMELAGQRLYEEAANSPEALNPESWRDFDKRLDSLHQDTEKRLLAEGYRPSKEARRAAQGYAMAYRGSFGRKFISESNNQIAGQIVSDTEKNLDSITEIYLRDGDLDGAVGKATRSIAAVYDGLSPAQGRALKDAANDRLQSAWAERVNNETARLEQSVVSGTTNYADAAAELERTFEAGKRFDSDPVAFEKLRKTQLRRVYDAEATGLINEGLVDEAEKFIGEVYGTVPRPTAGRLERFSPTEITTAMRQVESGGDPNAVSSKGAIGLMQVMPATAAEIADDLNDPDFPRTGLADVQRYLSDPDVSQRYGDAYYAKMLDRYGNDREAALIAYNGGPERADAWIKSGRDYSVLPKETREYPQKVVAALGAANSIAGLSGRETRDVLQASLVPGKRMDHIEGMQPAFATRLAGMIANAPPELRAGLQIGSGFRTPERQAELWQQALAKYGTEAEARKWVAPPGHSQHNHGNAADLYWNGQRLDSAPPEIVRQVHDLAGQHGLKFPLGNEAWHIEASETRGGEGNEPLDPSLSQSLVWQERIDSRRKELVAGETAAKEAERARKAAIENKAQALIKDDVTQIRETGVGRDDLTPARVQEALGPDKALDWISDRGEAAAEFTALSGIESMPADEMDSHLAKLEPAVGQDGYDAALRLHDKAETRIKEVRNERESDPAKSVVRLPEVVSAAGAFDTAQPAASWQRLISSRFAAQERVGIPIELQRPVTEDEAKVLAAGIRNAPPDKWFDRFDSVATGVNANFGEYADEVMLQIVGEFVKDDDKAIYAGRIINDIIAGQAPKVSDARALDDMTETKRVQDTAEQLSGNVTSDPWKRGYAVPRGMNLPVPKPLPDDIDYLKANPGTLSQFIDLYGEGQVPEGLNAGR